MGKAKTPHNPEIDLEKISDIESVQVIDHFDTDLRRHPELYVFALNTVYSVGQSAVDTVVEFVGVEGKNSMILHNLRSLFDERIDLEIIFDKTTEEAIDSDETITRIKDKKENRTAEEAFLLRRKRLLKYARLVVEWSRHEENDIAEAV